MPHPKSSFTAGDFPPNPLHKVGYHLEFHDEFDGTVLDNSKWVASYLPHWSSRAQSTANYALQDDSLILMIVENQPPWCPEFDGEVRTSTIQTGLYAGPVGGTRGQLHFSDALIVREAQKNVKKYLPTYGYFELRAKGPDTSANHASMWMIGYEDAPERSGEICVFEILGEESGRGTSKVRFGIHPWADPNLQEEFYIEQFDLDTTCFHIYAVEWMPNRVDFFIDNHLVKTINQSPAYQMQFMLGIYEHPFEGAWTGRYDPAAPYPKSFTVDYFRGYQPNTPYSQKPE